MLSSAEGNFGAVLCVARIILVVAVENFASGHTKYKDKNHTIHSAFLSYRHTVVGHGYNEDRNEWPCRVSGKSMVAPHCDAATLTRADEAVSLAADCSATIMLFPLPLNFT